MKDLTNTRQNNVIARGEISNHSHVIIGDATITREGNEIFVDVHTNAKIRHLLEREYVETGKEIWTDEHIDIELTKGTYKFIQEIEYQPYSDTIDIVND